MAEQDSAATLTADAEAMAKEINEQVRALTLAAARFSANLALFGVEQLRNSTEVAMDPKKELSNVKTSIVNVSDAIKANLSKQDQETADNLGKMIGDFAGRVLDVLYVPVMDVRKVVGAGLDSIGHVIGAASSMVPGGEKKSEAGGNQTATGGN